MAGRGCVISLEVVGNCGGSSKQGSRCMSLPVALHSPLDVLKEQLEEITGIEVKNQVLILCDLSDPDRNNDVLLTGKDFKTLRECGIKNGSSLTLHPLGVQLNFKRHIPKNECSKKDVVCSDKVCTLETQITPAMADHSYNGIIFDMSAKGPFEVTINSVSVGGMLGVVRIFTRDRPWEHEKSLVNPNAHYWAYQETISREGWTKIAEVPCIPSWDKPFEIFFDHPVTLLPHSKRGFYIHSGLPDDLGIQYQSYRKDAIVAEDEHIAIYPGVGHTGSVPFDEHHGWYRSWRGLAGAVSYSCKRKGWHPHQHLIFPAELKRAVLTMLLVHLKGATCPGSCRLRNGLHIIPQHVLYYTMEFMHWDWFQEMIQDNQVFEARTRSSGSGVTGNRGYLSSSNPFMSQISSTTTAFLQHIIYGGGASALATFGVGGGGSESRSRINTEYLEDDDDEDVDEDVEEEDEEDSDFEGMLEEKWEEEDEDDDDDDDEEEEEEEVVMNATAAIMTDIKDEDEEEDTMDMESEDI